MTEAIHEMNTGSTKYISHEQHFFSTTAKKYKVFSGLYGSNSAQQNHQLLSPLAPSTFWSDQINIYPFQANRPGIFPHNFLRGVTPRQPSSSGELNF